MKNPLDELEEHCGRQSIEGKHVVSIDYVLKMIREAKRVEMRYKPPDNLSE